MNCSKMDHFQAESEQISLQGTMEQSEVLIKVGDCLYGGHKVALLIISVRVQLSFWSGC